EDPAVAAPRLELGGTAHRRPRVFRLGEYRVDLVRRADHVRELHAAPAAAVFGGAIRCELVAWPEAEDHAVGQLEEVDVAVGRHARPAEALVEVLRAVDVGDAQRHEGQPLLHVPSVAQMTVSAYRIASATSRLPFADVVAHPRISVNSISSLRQPFADDVALWSELGITHVGLISPKLDAEGWDTSRQLV